MLFNLITGCEGLTTFLEKMTSFTCFDLSGSNDISHLKVQSATFLGLRSRSLAETLTAGMIEKIPVS